MPSSALYTHFQALFASQQSSLALEQLHKLANSIPSDETREQVYHLLQAQPPHWESAITLLEQALTLLKEEQKSNVLLVIGDENYSFQNIIGSIININKIERKPLPQYLTPIPAINIATDCIGRETELSELDQLLHSSPKVALIRGLGGIGKTTLAQAYLSLHLQDYQHLAWITQGDDLIQSIALDASLAESLDKPFQASEDLPTRFIQLLQALRAIPGPNLLVIDNATEQVSSPNVLPYLPSAPHWKVLVTSRQDLPDFVPLELQVLQPAAALQLFRLHYAQGNDAEVMDLLHEIGYHTLTTELMAKTLERQNGLLSVADLLASFRNRSLDDPDLEEKLSARHSGVAERGLFQYLMRLYNVAALGEKEIWVLQQLAVLPAIPIKPSLLAEWLEQAPKELNRTLNGLVDQGWLSKQEEGFVVHRLIQELIKYKQTPGVEELAALIEAMKGKMSLGAYGNPVTDNFPWLPYAEKVAEYFKDEEVLPESVSTLWSDFANALREFGNYPRAVQFLEKALDSDLRNLGINHPNVARKQSNLANVLLRLGDYQRTAQLLQNALDSDLRHFGPSHAFVARDQSNLANVLRYLGDYHRATQLLESAMESDLRNFGPGHPTIAINQLNLALVFQDLGEYHRAAQLLQSALDADLRNFGPDHPTIAIHQFNLAFIFRDLGDSARAAELLEMSLASDLRNFGVDHPRVAVLQSNLANVLSELGENGRASQLLALALASDLRNFGADHLTVALSQWSLASIYYKVDRLEEAKLLLEQALRTIEKSLGLDHPHYQGVLNWLDAVNKKLDQAS